MNYGELVESYAAHLNAPRGHLNHEERLLFDVDLAKARAVMERAWLEATPTRRGGLDGFYRAMTKVRRRAR